MKKKLGIILAVAAAIIIATVFAVYAGGGNERRLKQSLADGSRFLNELKYDQAISSFMEALDIAPRSSEAMEGYTDAVIARAKQMQADSHVEEAETSLEDALSWLERNGVYADNAYYPEAVHRIEGELDALRAGLEQKEQETVEELQTPEQEEKDMPPDEQSAASLPEEPEPADDDEEARDEGLSEEDREKIHYALEDEFISGNKSFTFSDEEVLVVLEFKEGTEEIVYTIDRENRKLIKKSHVIYWMDGSVEAVDEDEEISYELSSEEIAVRRAEMARMEKELVNTLQMNGILPEQYTMHSEFAYYTGQHRKKWETILEVPGGNTYSFESMIWEGRFQTECSSIHYGEDRTAHVSVGDEYTGELSTEMTDPEVEFEERVQYFRHQLYGDGENPEEDLQDRVVAVIDRAFNGYSSMLNEACVFLTEEERRNQLEPLAEVLQEYIDWYASEPRMAYDLDYSFGEYEYEKMMSLYHNNSHHEFLETEVQLENGSQVELPEQSTARYLLAYVYLLQGEKDRCLEERSKLADMFGVDALEESRHSNGVTDEYGRYVSFTGSNEEFTTIEYGEGVFPVSITSENSNGVFTELYEYDDQGRLSASTSVADRKDGVDDSLSAAYSYSGNVVTEQSSYGGYQSRSYAEIRGFGLELEFNYE